MSAWQFAAVALDANGKVGIANLASDTFIGVLENKPKLNEHATVELGPCVTKVKAGAAVTVGNYLTVQSGNFIAGNKLLYTTAASGTTANVGSKTSLVGLCLETVSSGGVFTAKIFESPTTINS